jgi:peroxiredoxin family protein
MKEISELSHVSFKSIVFSPFLMKTTFTAVVVAAFAIIGGIFGTTAPALAQTNATDTATPDMSMDMGGDMMAMMREMSANHKWGMISSIQNDEQGQPAWVVAGHWMMEMASQNDTAASDTTGRISNVSGFNAILHMVMLNGSAMHNHEISNFTQTGDATFDSSTNSTTITGTATITMREGPVPDVQTTIEIAQDKVIAISPDPAALENHFGDTPIYGIVISPEMIEQMMQSYGDRGGMMQGPMSGMMNSSGGM